MLRRLLPLVLVFSFAMSGVAAATEPPNPNDPCSKGGKDTCNTTGVGSYRDSRYGPRWFGDYRGAVPDVTAGTFCIDLRFWYPSKAYQYATRSTAGLRSRGGKAVPSAKLHQMSYAIWRLGKTDPAAVMLFVHSLVGDSAPGEINPADLTPSSRKAFQQLSSEAPRYAGPYKVQATLPAKLVAGKAAQLKVSVLSAAGRRVPDVSVTLKATGADGLATKVDTGDSGVATVPITGDDPATGVTLDATTEPLAADSPALYVPTHGASARNGQRLVGPATASESTHVEAAVRAAPTVVTQVSAASLAPGSTVSDTVHVSGLMGQTVTVQAALYGPYPARAGLTCTDAPIWTGSFTAAADGDYTTAPTTLTVPGYYVYRESIADSPTVQGVQTDCAQVPETTIVHATPAVLTQVSAQATAPGAQLTDTAVVSGLGRLAATVNVELWGPYPTRAAITCQGTPFWTGAITANGDGAYISGAATLTAAGYYTYRESIAGTEAFDAVSTACGDAAETTLAKGAPAVTTAVSSIVSKPGSSLFDKITVTGLGKTPATVAVELFGPYASRADIDCAGTPYWKGSVDVTGDGTFSSPTTTVKRAGFYVYREHIAGSETVTAVDSECADVAETLLSAPLILTGRGDERVAHVVAARAAATTDPTRVRLARLGVDAPVSAVAIDTKEGALGIPSDISKVGWWSDSASPGDAAGAILLAGHIDSAKKGAGAFYPLQQARRGDVVLLTSRNGKVRRYKVTSVQKMLKSALPTSIFASTGGARLVLVTCGGPFDAKAGHYRDNVVVTAAPA